MSDESSKEGPEIEVLLVATEISSGEEQPMSEWSSLDLQNLAENDKKKLYDEGLYSPGSSTICKAYIPMSDSSVWRHEYYNYPAVLDPGIERAVLGPAPTFIYPEDGQQLYLDLCAEMNICPVRLFYRNLLSAEIDLSYYGVQPKGVRAMALALENNPNVTQFDLTDNCLNDDCCFHLGYMLIRNNTLREVTLNGCRIGKSGMFHLGDNFNRNRTLMILNLARNQLNDEGGVILANMIAFDFKIKKINLSKNNLGRETCEALAKSLEFNNPITHLDLSWNNFVHVPSAVKMLEQLAKSTVLEDLNLSFNAFDNDRIGIALRKLMKIPTLKNLDLSYNRLKAAVIIEVSKGLISAKKLEKLNLSFNPMTPVDAYQFLETMLKPRVKLQCLMMENVCVEPPFLDLLKKVMMMKSRKNFVVTYGEVLQYWTIAGPNVQQTILNRVIYLGTTSKKNKVDMALYFLALNKEIPKPIPVKEFIERIGFDKLPLNEELIEELAMAFGGPRTPKSRTVSIETICDYIKRLWPDKKLPPTPPPEPEPEPAPPPPPPKKGKNKK